MEAIAIFLVIFCHYPTLGYSFWDNALMTLCFVAVPVFFMVNGALTLGRETMDLRRHCVQTLHRYLVACLWRGIYLIVFIVREYVDPALLDPWSVISYLLFWTGIDGCNVGHMWFMRTLLAISLLAPLLHSAMFGKHRRPSLILFILAVLAVPFVVQDFNTLIAVLSQHVAISPYVNLSGLMDFLPYGYGREMLLFYILGAWLAGSNSQLTQRLSRHSSLWFALGFFVAWFYMLATKAAIDGTWTWNETLFQEGYTRISTALASLCLFLCLYLSETQITGFQGLLRSFVEQVSIHTQGIYYLHWIFAGIAIGSVPIYSLAANLLRTLVIFLLAFFVSFPVPTAFCGIPLR